MKRVFIKTLEMFSCVLCVNLLIIIIPLQVHAANKLNLYVWDFGTRNKVSNELANYFTIDFGRALVRTKCCTVLDRSNHDRLQSQKNNEIGIMSINNISESFVDTLKILEANAVVFGEVFDDVNSGDIIVTVEVQTFDSERIASEHIEFPRGLKDDATNRMESMEKLAKKLCIAVNGEDNHVLEEKKGVLDVAEKLDNLTGRWNHEGHGIWWVFKDENNQLVIDPKNSKRGPFLGKLESNNKLYVNFHDDPGCCNGVLDDAVIRWSNGVNWALEKRREGSNFEKHDKLTGRWNHKGHGIWWILKDENNHLIIDSKNSKRGPFSGNLESNNKLYVNFHDDPGCCNGVLDDATIRWSNGVNWSKLP